MEVKTKRYTYQTTVRWSDQKKGTMTAGGKPVIQVATPPEFKGHVGIWSPEDLFVASVNVCIMSTFLAFAERKGLVFTAYESDAEGSVELKDGKFQVTAITVKPRITIKQGEDPDKAKEIIEKAEANCLVSNSITSLVTVEPTIS